MTLFHAGESIGLNVNLPGVKMGFKLFLGPYLPSGILCQYWFLPHHAASNFKYILQCPVAVKMMIHYRPRAC